jgi:hypothetical protein
MVNTVCCLPLLATLRRAAARKLAYLRVTSTPGRARHLSSALETKAPLDAIESPSCMPPLLQALHTPPPSVPCNTPVYGLQILAAALSTSRYAAAAALPGSHVPRLAVRHGEPGLEGPAVVHDHGALGAAAEEAVGELELRARGTSRGASRLCVFAGCCLAAGWQVLLSAGEAASSLVCSSPPSGASHCSDRRDQSGGLSRR